MAKRVTTESFIERAKCVFGDIYDYSKINLINTSKKVEIICKKHGPFWICAASHINKPHSGCRECYHDKLRIPTPIEEFKKTASLKHNNKYNYDKVFYSNLNDKVEIVCPKHESFFQTAARHQCGAGCFKCGREETAKKNKYTEEEFRAKLLLNFNDKIDFTKLSFINIETPVILDCKVHGEFTRNPRGLLDGFGCPKCEREIVDSANRLTLDEFLEMAKSVHGDLYDYSLVKYITSNVPVDIICKKHGIFKQRPSNHIHSGHNCPKCKRKQPDEFFDDCNKLYKNKYTYDIQNFTRLNNYINIICPNHGLFRMVAFRHLHGFECPKCKSPASKPETKWLDSLNIPHLERQKKIYINDQKFVVDGYDDKTKIIYEFLGDFWHSNPDLYDLNKIHAIKKTPHQETYDKTFKKIKTLESGGYKVIYIWENDFKCLTKNFINNISG